MVAKDALKEVGVAYAGWRGTCHSVSLLGTDENWPLTVYFELLMTDEEDKYTASIDRIEFGQYSLLNSNLLHSGYIWETINMIYGNQDNVAVPADTGLFSVTYFLSKKDSTLDPSVEQPPVTRESSGPVPTQDSTANTEDRSKWDYEDYVEYYGFDPADYGYYWYNEIKNGPLEDFFEFVSEVMGESAGISRLYQDAWLSDLTGEDFVGTWQTENGILFTIDRMGDNGIIEDYTIDFSENEGLGILGGWFSEDIYNLEGGFCGMSGSSGVTSYSVSYQYGTESSETNTWLFLEFVDSEGNAVRDSVPLVRDGVPCL